MVTETQTSWLTQTVHFVTINALLPCPLHPLPHFSFLTLVIYILPISIASYMISKLITKRSLPQWKKKKKTYEAQAFQRRTPIFMVCFLQHRCGKANEQLVISVPRLTNFACTTDCKTPVGCDEKVPGLRNEWNFELPAVCDVPTTGHQTVPYGVLAWFPLLQRTFDFQIHEATDLLAEQYLWLRLEVSSQ